jgi:signal transduction histidine kinase
VRRFFKDTIFSRLFALLMTAIIISHLMTFALMASFYREGSELRPPPPHMVPLPHQTDFFRGIMPPPPAVHDMYPPPRGTLPPGLWIGLITQFFALTVAAWFGAKILARPIQRLANAAAQLGATMNSPMIEEEGPAEARRAAHVFNRMQSRIRAHLEERGRFLAAVSHDLRTPLTRMKLRMERPNEEIQRDRLLGDINEMTDMLDATLDYFRGEASIESQQLLDVQALVESMVEDAKENGHDVAVSGEAEALLTLPIILRRCLSNLMENALRYGESAKLCLIDAQECLTIEIRDKGPGIPANRIHSVFEPFVRLDSSRNKSYGGVGLGLSIAKEAARQCGGKLTLRNAEGGGLIASVLLPRVAIFQ